VEAEDEVDGEGECLERPGDGTGFRGGLAPATDGVFFEGSTGAGGEGGVDLVATDAPEAVGVVDTDVTAGRLEEEDWEPSAADRDAVEVLTPAELLAGNDAAEAMEEAEAGDVQDGVPNTADDGGAEGDGEAEADEECEPAVVEVEPAKGEVEERGEGAESEDKGAAEDEEVAEAGEVAEEETETDEDAVELAVTVAAAAVWLSRPRDLWPATTSGSEPGVAGGLLFRCCCSAAVSSSSSSITRVVLTGGTAGALVEAAEEAARRAEETSETVPAGGPTEIATADLGTAFLGCFLPLTAAVGSDLAELEFEAALEFGVEEEEAIAAVEDRPGPVADRPCPVAERAPEAASDARRKRRAAFSCWCRTLSASCIPHEPPIDQIQRQEDLEHISHLFPLQPLLPLFQCTHPSHKILPQLRRLALQARRAGFSELALLVQLEPFLLQLCLLSAAMFLQRGQQRTSAPLGFLAQHRQLGAKMAGRLQLLQ
jgi:hypothetical protein